MENVCVCVLSDSTTSYCIIYVCSSSFARHDFPHGKKFHLFPTSSFDYEIEPTTTKQKKKNERASALASARRGMYAHWMISRSTDARFAHCIIFAQARGIVVGIPFRSHWMQRNFNAINNVSISCGIIASRLIISTLSQSAYQPHSAIWLLI